MEWFITLVAAVAAYVLLALTYACDEAVADADDAKRLAKAKVARLLSLVGSYGCWLFMTWYAFFHVGVGAPVIIAGVANGVFLVCLLIAASLSASRVFGTALLLVPALSLLALWCLQ